MIGVVVAAVPWRVRLVDDWKHAWKFSSLWVTTTFAAIYEASPALLGMAADHWPEVAPFIAHHFPNQDPSLWPAVGAALTILARITSFYRKKPA